MLKFLLLIGLLGAIAWAIAKPGYDSILAVITALGALITNFAVPKKPLPQQNQIVGEKGFGIQAGESVNMGSIYKDLEDKQ